MSQLSRREFVRAATFATAGTRLVSLLPAAAAAGAVTAATARTAMPVAGTPGAAPVRWLDGKAPAAAPGTTWGVSWAIGRCPADTALALFDAQGRAVPMQSWPLATWPDGSLKWTAHALPVDAVLEGHGELRKGPPAAPARPLTARETGEANEIDTGVIRARVAKRGGALVTGLWRGGREIARDGKLVCLLEDRSVEGVAGATREVAFNGEIDAVTLEQGGPVRAVVKIEGKHAGEGRAWLPFVVRLYFYAGGEARRCGCCTRSPSTGTSSGTSSRGWACVSRCRSEGRGMIGMCGLRGSMKACSARRCGSSRACGAIRARRCGRRR